MGAIAIERQSSPMHIIDASWPLRRLTVDQYHWLIERGFFTDDDRLELIDGFPVEMCPIHPPRASSVDALAEALTDALDKQARIRVQQPITLPEQDSEPEPEIVVAQRRRYMRRHPIPNDILLVYEVADATLSRDRNEKLRLYAQVGIPEYWIVNLIDGVIEVYRTPKHIGARPTYATRSEFGPGETVAPLTFPDCQIEVSQIIPDDGSDAA